MRKVKCAISSGEVSLTRYRPLTNRKESVAKRWTDIPSMKERVFLVASCSKKTGIEHHP